MDRLERVVVVLAVAPWVILALAATRPKPVEVRLTPRFSNQGTPLRLAIHVEPNAHNRQLDWAVASDTGYERAGGYQPDRAPLPTTEIVLKDVPAGRYVAVAWLTDDKAKTVQSMSVEACVSGGNFSCADGE